MRGFSLVPSLLLIRSCTSKTNSDVASYEYAFADFCIVNSLLKVLATAYSFVGMLIHLKYLL